MIKKTALTLGLCLASTPAVAQCTSSYSSDFTQVRDDIGDTGHVSGGNPAYPSSATDTGDMWFRHPLDASLLADLNTAVASGCLAQIVYSREASPGALGGDAIGCWDFTVGTFANDSGTLILMDDFEDADCPTVAATYTTTVTVPVTSTVLSALSAGDLFAVRALGMVAADAVGSTTGDYTRATYSLDNGLGDVVLEYELP